MEQVYREIDLRDAVLIGQINTRINLLKDKSSKRVRFSDEEENNSGQKYVMIYSSVVFNSLITRDRITLSFIQVRINQA